MDKTDFSVSKMDNVKFTFQKLDVEIIPYLSQIVKMNIAKNYVELLSAEGDFVQNYYSAEWSIIMTIIDQCTNINLDSKQFENIIDSGLWDEIKSKIVNYEDFIKELKEIYKMISEKTAFKKSLEQSIANISDSIVSFINYISDLDLSKEGISELVKTLESQAESIKENFPTINSETYLPTKSKNKRKAKSEENGQEENTKDTK